MSLICGRFYESILQSNGILTGEMIPSLRVAVFLLLWIETHLVSSVKLPPDMTQGIFCESCSATMKELDKILQKKTSDPRELQVVEAMEDICQAKYFSTYDYSPPTTVKACRFLIEHYEEDIEAMLFRKETETEQKVCYELTKACEGVDRTKKEKEKTDVRFNDQPQKVTRGEVPQKEDDGINRINVDINDPKSAERLAEQIKEQVRAQQFGGQDYQGNEDEDDDEDDDEEEEVEEKEEEEDGDDDSSEGNDDVDGGKKEKTEL